MLKMPLKYINRKGKTFYLHQGTTKTGKPKYFFSLKTEGQLVKTLPEGYEIYENPKAQVFLQKKQPKLITEEELELIRKGIEEFSEVDYYLVEAKKNIITIYLADQDMKVIEEMLKTTLKARGVKFKDLAQEIVSYSPMMRFILSEEKKRRYLPQRFCFIGSSDDWIDIGSEDSLSNLVEMYLKHLGQDSYFELG